MVRLLTDINVLNFFKCLLIKITGNFYNVKNAVLKYVFFFLIIFASDLLTYTSLVFRFLLFSTFCYNN